MYEIYTIHLVSLEEEVIREIRYLDEASSYREKVSKRLEKRPDMRVYFRKKED